MLNLYRGFEIFLVGDRWSIKRSNTGYKKSGFASVRDCAIWIDKYWDGSFC